ncbi:hypothetical protein CORT_0B02240 [Candida orthopsilosis Co 90-125]|uniref:Post-GPI attachment to proteins factor 3 n=1 Tax=Candida orthopsilosis (strain 90-125) TaxID=1136231 RepID=H8X0Q3_CANO9|nr:hypothetical protein CORT_0B02240 [Candida orthopsilosis Co 90-125]CCG21942.1 hypothetical protein CORT_0B02240 [Candida orthopsilosis Co 90-125]
MKPCYSFASRGNHCQHHRHRLIIFVTTLLLLCPALIQASTGDQLPAFQQCLKTCQCQTLPSKYTVIGWSCTSNCNYYCQQIVTDERKRLNLPVVQFYGKWPFKTVLGVQEFWSTVFSLGNLYVNYSSFKVIYREFKRLPKGDNVSTNTSMIESRVLYFQSMILLAVSCIGWCFSSLFHFRDTSFTEVLDYFGAFAIILCNLNVIVVRYFKLYKLEYQLRLKLWQLSLFSLYAYHIIRLFLDWDYSYNMNINVVLGLSAMILWFLHSFNVGQIYNKNINLVNNTIALLPYETNILQKLHLTNNYLLGYTHKKLSSASLCRWIPYIPVFNNAILLCGLYLEINDFEPWQRLVDAHSLWHLLTIFPSYIWFDWNVWDVEMSKVTGTL